MNDLALFDSFSKGQAISSNQSNNCVIYTRVSTKEQADNNMSLETQRKHCEQFALKNQYQIRGYFGGTYESAKTDERKEFNRMLAFVRKSKEKIVYIIVYSVDRFSRSGANAIYLTEQLKKQGILLHSVSQPTDITTPSGNLQQNIQFIFSEYDNQLRRQKCMAGVKEMLLRGDWPTMPPMGYSIIRENGLRRIMVNEKGKLLKKAFLWKAHERITNDEICKRFAALGLKLADQRLSDMFRNPFYCGLMVHNMLDGEVVEGNYEKMISKEIFLKANKALPHHKDGIQLKCEREEAPLKRFLKCDKCKRPYTAYRKKETLWYYKCSSKGCNCNLNARQLHEDFKYLLKDMSLAVSPSIANLIAQDMEAVYLESNKENTEQRSIMNRNLTELNNKLLKLNERFIEGDIDRDTYRQMKEKFEGERGQIEQQIAKTGTNFSNLQKCAELAVEFSSNLPSLWDLSNYANKQRIQYLVFPEGIFVDKETRDYRTPKVNSVFLYFARLKQVLKENKNGKTDCNINFPASVVWGGIEPPTQGFSVLCSTN